MIFTDLFESRDICRVCGQTPCNCTHIVESTGSVGDTIRSLYQQFYDQGDDALEYLNTHAENFARYWDRFEGDLDSMIEELPPKILAKLAQELQSVAGQEGLEEAFIAPALSAANAAAEHQRGAGGYRGRVDVKVGSREEYMSALKTLRNAAQQAGQHIEVGRNGSTMSVFSDSLGSDELGQFVDNTLKQGVAEGLADTQQKIVDTINKLEDRLKHDKTPEQWDNIKNRIDRLQAGLNRSKQGVAEVSDQTLTSYLTKVDADSQKHEKDPTKRSPEKRNKSVSGFARAFNKLDARKEKTDKDQMQENDLAQQMLALAKKVSPNARIAGTPEQERERTQQMMAQRAKDRENQPAQQVGDEQRAQLQAKLKGLEAQFDPNYQYSDDYTFWSRQNAIAQQISGIRKQLGLTEVSKKTLGDYLHSAHKDVVDRATSSSFQSGQVGDKYNKADVSPKERQREKGMARAVARLTREGSSMAEAWASRYPNINADIAECQSSGDADRLKKLMTIKDIIDSDLREQSGLGFGQ